MKKNIVYLFIIIFICFILLCMYQKLYAININYPCDEFSLDNMSIEKNCDKLTSILSEENIFNNYQLSEIVFYPSDKGGYITYTNLEKEDVFLINIEDNVFVSAVKYSSNSREAKRLCEYPIDKSLVKVHSSDLSDIIKKQDKYFLAENITYIKLLNNMTIGKTIWTCVYNSENGYKFIEIDATMGDILVFSRY